jgi:hypothetical protein
VAKNERHKGTTKAIKLKDGEGCCEKETRTYDWRHKDSFNIADHRQRSLGGVLVSSATERQCTLSPDARMPSCPPLHIANPNVPQSLDDASVGPVTVTAGGDSELWVRGTGVVFSWCMYFLEASALQRGSGPMR